MRDLTEAALSPADVVVANLTGTLLARHADALAALVRKGGSLIVAGFTIDEKPLVLEAFESAFTLSESAEEDDWWALVVTRRAESRARGSRARGSRVAPVPAIRRLR